MVGNPTLPPRVSQVKIRLEVRKFAVPILSNLVREIQLKNFSAPRGGPWDFFFENFEKFSKITKSHKTIEKHPKRINEIKKVCFELIRALFMGHGAIFHMPKGHARAAEPQGGTLGREFSKKSENYKKSQNDRKTLKTHK